MNTKACVVLVTCGSLEEARTIADAIVSEGLAACANLIGEGSRIQSVYMWEGALQHESEILMVIKTRIDKLTALETRIKALHSYTVPEFIAIPIIGGSAEYLQWLESSVTGPA